MAKTVIAVYDRLSAANGAVKKLIANGFARDEISLVAGDVNREYEPHVGKIGVYDRPDESVTQTNDATAEGAGVGAGIGAILGGLGGLLVGLGALAIPGIGPVIAAGPLAAALAGLAGAGVGAVAGGVTGGLIGALVDLGVPEESAGIYAEAVRRGGTMVTVMAGDTRADLARDILDDFGPVDVEERAETWRAGGWQGYDPQAEPYTLQDLERDQGPYAAERLEYDEDYPTFDEDFRSHYAETYVGGEHGYNYYQPAYYYGYSLAHDNEYRNQDWTAVAPNARRDWEHEHPESSWDQVEDAVHHAWMKTKQGARDLFD